MVTITARTTYSSKRGELIKRILATKRMATPKTIETIHATFFCHFSILGIATT
jgi:hypothetical protein